MESNTTGRDVVHVTEDDTGNEGEIVSAGDVDADAPSFKVTGQGRGFGAVTIKHDLYSSQRIRLSKQYVQDTATPSVVARMANIAGRRIGRGLAKALAHGDSANGVAGCSNLGYLETNPQVSTHVLAPIGTNDGKSKGGIVFEHFTNAFANGMDPAYWPDSVLLVSADTLGVIWTLKDGERAPCLCSFLGRRRAGHVGVAGRCMLSRSWMTLARARTLLCMSIRCC